MNSNNHYPVNMKELLQSLLMRHVDIACFGYTLSKRWYVHKGNLPYASPPPGLWYSEPETRLHALWGRYSRHVGGIIRELAPLLDEYKKHPLSDARERIIQTFEQFSFDEEAQRDHAQRWSSYETDEEKRNREKQAEARAAKTKAKKEPFIKQASAWLDEQLNEGKSIYDLELRAKGGEFDEYQREVIHNRAEYERYLERLYLDRLESQDDVVQITGNRRTREESYFERQEREEREEKRQRQAQYEEGMLYLTNDYGDVDLNY